MCVAPELLPILHLQPSKATHQNGKVWLQDTIRQRTGPLGANLSAKACIPLRPIYAADLRDAALAGRNAPVREFSVDFTPVDMGVLLPQSFTHVPASHTLIDPGMVMTQASLPGPSPPYTISLRLKLPGRQ